MVVHVKIPTPLRKLTGGASEAMLDGNDIKELIKNLEIKYPGIGDRICDENGNIRRFVNIYLNNEDIRFLKGSETSLKEGDEISIVPAIAGGSH